MTHKLKVHCGGMTPVIVKEGKYWSVTCPNCGKRLGHQITSNIARENWNAKMECEMRMKGHDDD